MQKSTADKPMLHTLLCPCVACCTGRSLTTAELRAVLAGRQTFSDLSTAWFIQTAYVVGARCHEIINHPVLLVPALVQRCCSPDICSSCIACAHQLGYVHVPTQLKSMLLVCSWQLADNPSCIA
jgi:hypothetical protein